MKTFTSFFSRNSALALFAAMFFMASCSKETAYISQYDKLAYEQSVKPSVTTDEMTMQPTEIAAVENTTDQDLAPTLHKKDIENKATTGKEKKNAITAFNKIKEKAPKAIKNLKAENLAGITLLASAAKEKNKSMLEGKLRLAIIFLLVGLILGFFGGIVGWVGWILTVIGLVFLILWLLEQI